jgi:acetaldehyde dehydrogenase
VGNTKIGCAIIGSGNIGTDLLIKIKRLSKVLEIMVLVGVDPASDGLARAGRLGVQTTHEGIEGLRAMSCYGDIKIVFDATSAKAHAYHAELLLADGKQVIDLTPAAIGPLVVPPANLDEHLDASNVNMVTCGGQATIPMIKAISRVAAVQYAEIVASIASRSAGPGTRANIDEFTETTAKAIEVVGGARVGRAIIVLNPAEPALIMRDTVICLSDEADTAELTASIEQMVAEVQAYVPGYRLKQPPQYERITADDGVVLPETGALLTGIKTTILLEVEGAGHYLPAYAGNLDIMTSAALKTAERIAASRNWTGALS